MALFCNCSNLSPSSFFLLTLPIFFSFIHATVFEIQNKCPYTVWAAAIPGGGRQLDEGQSWNLTVRSNTTGGRIWGRTNCIFDESGRGSCESGGCGDLLQCETYGSPPNTVTEYSLQLNDLDFFGITVVDGFNIPMEFSPTSNGCRIQVNCTGDINGLCPNELRDPGGCNNPCTVFENDQYCCNAGGSCNATVYSIFFKERCPDAFSYPMDDAASTFSCPVGTNFRVVFCP